MFITDDKAAKLSKMLKRKAICNGEKSGYECIHYFPFGAKTESNDPEFLGFGEKFRNCTVCPGYLIEFDGEDNLPHTCRRYEPDAPLLVKIGHKIKKVLFGRKYDPTFEVYKPMTPEEVVELTREAHSGGTVPTLAETRGLGVGAPVPGSGIRGATMPMSEEDMAKQYAELVKEREVSKEKAAMKEKLLDDLTKAAIEDSQKAFKETSSNSNGSFDGVGDHGVESTSEVGTMPSGVAVKGGLKKTTISSTSNETKKVDEGIFGRKSNDSDNSDDE